MGTPTYEQSSAPIIAKSPPLDHATHSQVTLNVASTAPCPLGATDQKQKYKPKETFPKTRASRTRRARMRLPTMAEMWKGLHFPESIHRKRATVYKREKHELIDDPTLDPLDLPLQRDVEGVYRCLLDTCDYKGEWAHG